MTTTSVLRGTRTPFVDPSTEAIFGLSGGRALSQSKLLP
jgi:hypothetical protein